jgi:hypothetical protein
MLRKNNLQLFSDKIKRSWFDYFLKGSIFVVRNKQADYGNTNLKRV